jgi:hypothetical protein
LVIKAPNKSSGQEFIASLLNELGDVMGLETKADNLNTQLVLLTKENLAQYNAVFD